MNAKRLIMVGLVGLNIALLSALVILSYDLPEAQAQGSRRGGQYVSVTATYTAGNDMLVLLHASKGELVALAPVQGGREMGQLTLLGTRDVKADLDLAGN